MDSATDSRVGRHDYTLAKLRQAMNELLGSPDPDEWPARAAEVADLLETVRVTADGGRAVPKVAVVEEIAQQELEYRLKKGLGQAVTSDVVKRETEKHHGFEPNPKTVQDALKHLAERFDHVEYESGTPGRGGRNARVVVRE